MELALDWSTARGVFSLEAATAPTPLDPRWSVPFRIESLDARCLSVLGFGGLMSGSMVSREIGRCSGGVTAQFHGEGTPSTFESPRFFSQVTEMPFPAPVVGTVRHESNEVPFAMITRLGGQCPPGGASEALWLFGLPPSHL